MKDVIGLTSQVCSCTFVRVSNLQLNSLSETLERQLLTCLKSFGGVWKHGRVQKIKSLPATHCLSTLPTFYGGWRQVLTLAWPLTEEGVTSQGLSLFCHRLDLFSLPVSLSLLLSLFPGGKKPPLAFMALEVRAKFCQPGYIVFS